MTVPYQYQLDSLDRIEGFGGRALLGHSMGLGKSFISLLYASENRSRRPVLIVCPAFLKENWRRECLKHFHWHAEVLSSLRPPKVRLPWDREGVYVINYDVLSPKGKYDGWLDELLKLRPNLLILDEAHYCISSKSARTKACKQLARKAPHVLALTGTAMTNRVTDLWPVLNMLRPKEFPYFSHFAGEYSRRVFTPWGMKYEGSRNLDKLHRVLNRSCMIRYRTEDVLTQLPQYARHVVPLPLSPTARAEYELAEKEFIKWLEIHKPERVRRAMLAEALVKAGYVMRLTAKLKLPAVKEWVQNCLDEDDGKLILFGTQIELVEELHRHWPKSSVLVYGGTAKDDRMKCVDRFNQDAKCRLFIANLVAGGQGWNATGCSTTAFFEFGWKPGDLSQAEKRTHGIGRGVQGRRSQAYYLVAENTIEEKICKVLQDRQEDIDQVLDGRITEEGINVFDLFLEEMDKKGVRA